MVFFIHVHFSSPHSSLTSPLWSIQSEFLNETYATKKLEGWGNCMVKIA